MKRQLIVGGIGLAALLALGVATYAPTNDTAVATTTVIFTANGFVPERIRVNVGDTVTFTSRAGEFWPASDPHPTHTLYGGFDAGGAIASGQSWTFTFTDEGAWDYHDHLSSTFRGTIVVGDTQDNCKSPTDTRTKQKCWIEELETVLEKKGADHAFATVKKLYAADPDFAELCHDTMHRIGAAAYETYRAGKKLNLTGDTSLCSFGFYHGFTETLVQEGGSAEDAIGFCKEVGDALSEMLPDIELQCHHGIGHGSVVVDDPRLWGDERAMIAPAKKICAATSRTSEQLQRCGTGIFDSISIAYFTHDYGLAMRPSDPFWLCTVQEEKEFTTSCYVSLNYALMWMTDLDLRKAAVYIEAIPETDTAVAAMGSIALSLTNVRSQRGETGAAATEQYYLNEGARICAALSAPLRIPCIRSVAYALSTSDGNNPHYEKGLAFCGESVTGQMEKSACYQSVAHTLAVENPPEKREKLCRAFPLTDQALVCSP